MSKGTVWLLGYIFGFVLGFGGANAGLYPSAKHWNALERRAKETKFEWRTVYSTKNAGTERF